MHCFNLVARDQWTGFEGHPFTGQFSYSGTAAPLGIENVGLGAVIVFDKIGFEQNVNVKLNGAYHFPLGNGKLGVGLDVGILQKGVTGNVVASNMSDPIVNDISGSKDMGFDLGFGAFYYVPKKMYFGISGQKLLPQKISLGSATPKIRQHAYITAGYYHPIGNSIVLKPNLLVKTDLSSTQLDVNLTAEYNEKIWLGASYRVQDAIVANVGYSFNVAGTDKAGNPKAGQPLKVGIAYDFTTQSLREKGTFSFWDENANVEDIKENNRSVGAIEVYLGYCFIPPPKPNFKQYVDPLFL
jgi:type IX secretion system PorP/SprF family membrane protein